MQYNGADEVSFGSQIIQIFSLVKGVVNPQPIL